MEKHTITILRNGKKITVEAIAYFHLNVTRKDYFIYGKGLDDDEETVDIYATEVVLGNLRYYLNKVEDIEANLMRIVIKALILHAPFERELAEYGYIPKEFSEINQYVIEETGSQKIVMEEKTYQKLLGNDELMIPQEEKSREKRHKQKDKSEKKNKDLLYVIVGGMIILGIICGWFYKDAILDIIKNRL